MTDSCHTPSPPVMLKKRLDGSKVFKNKIKIEVRLLLPGDAEIGSDGQRTVLITPRSQVQSLYGPFTECGPFYLRLFCDSVFQPE